MKDHGDESLIITIVQQGSHVHLRAARRTVGRDRNGKEYVSSQLLRHATIKDTRIADYPVDLLAASLVARTVDEINSLIPFLR